MRIAAVRTAAATAVTAVALTLFGGTGVVQAQPGPDGGDQRAGIAAAAPQQAASPAAEEGFVSVPDSYDYNPDANKDVTLHDYCTKSPDEFPAPGADNARFQGPCARHDMCYERNKGGSDDVRNECDDKLLANMGSNCEEYYAWYNPLREACKKTAGTYWAVVKVRTNWPG